MRSARPVGIAGYGAYVPRLRVRTSDISNAWRPRGSVAPAVAEKSVPGPDEDVVTMSIEAARTALDRAGTELERIGAVWVGTESKPYAVKPSATIVAEALGITPHVVAADMEFACKAGSEAMQAAVAFVGSGMVEAALAIGMDTAQSKPGDALEYTAACGGAAYLFADAEHALAVVDGSVSHVTDTPDFFRREGAAYPEHGGRFTGEPSYFRHTRAASRRLLEEVGAGPKDFAHAVFHQPVPKFVEKVASELGFTAAQVDTGLVARRGRGVGPEGLRRRPHHRRHRRGGLAGGAARPPRRARVLAVTSTGEKAAALQAAGAHEVIVSPDLRFAPEVRRRTAGEGAQVAIEIVGSLTFAETLKALAPGGRLVVVGNLKTASVEVNPGLVSRSWRSSAPTRPRSPSWRSSAWWRAAPSGRGFPRCCR